MDTCKIVIDTKGADKGSDVIIRGTLEALKQNEEMSALLVGDASHIESVCRELNAPMEKIEILDAPDEITNYDSPTAAIFTKTESSMVRSLVALGERDDLCGLITTGNTGALLSGSLRYLSGEKRIRPALAAILPCEDNKFVCLVDTGATVDCTPQMLHHFAHLGSDYMKKMYGIESPRIGLLSNGSEPTKGNKAVKEAHPLIRDDASLNFIGNVEGSKVLSGACDVLVCDGFAGNQILKASEGMAKRMITDIVMYAKQTQNESIMGLVKQLLSTYDLSALGGGIILGIDKPVIKARGSSDERAVISISKMILNMAQNKAIYDKNN